MITGSKLVRVLEEIADSQVRSITHQRDTLSSRIASEIEAGLEGQLTAEMQNSLRKGLKMNYPLNRRYRESALAWLPVELENELSIQFQRLERLSSGAHQARTQAAYVAGVLRPFNPKYIFRWLRDKPGPEAQVLRSRIEDLERVSIESPEALFRWAQAVADLFQELAVASQEDGSRSLKVAGQVAKSSSRTYLQSWLAFVKKFSDDILGNDVDLNQDTSPNSSLSDETNTPISSKVGKAPGRYNINRREKLISASDDWSTSPPNRQIRPISLVTDSEFANGASGAQPWKMPAAEEMNDGLTIYAKSPQGEHSSCNFESLEAAGSGTTMWLDALSMLWADQPGPVKFDVDLKTSASQFRFSLPQWRLEEAAAKLEHFISKLLASENNSK